MYSPFPPPLIVPTCTDGNLEGMNTLFDHPGTLQGYTKLGGQHRKPVEEITMKEREPDNYRRDTRYQGAGGKREELHV